MSYSRLYLAFVLLVSVACEGPVAVFSGGALTGPVKSVPASFEFARDAGTVQLETNPEEPYSVNIACAVAGSRLYVSAGDNKAQWVENMEADDRVRMRIRGEVYELRAERVTDPAEMRVFADEWTKYSWARDPTTLDVAWVYRLEAR